MSTSIIEDLKKLATVDLFEECRKNEAFVGRPFYLDYDRLRLMSNDKWKHNVSGVPAGAFLLAIYNGEPDVDEALLLRVIKLLISRCRDRDPGGPPVQSGNMEE